MLRIAARSFLVAIAVWLIAGAAIVLVLASRHEHMLSVQTASMAPTFRTGDAILVRPVSIKELHPGDVVSYHSMQTDSVVISHRVVSIERQAGRLMTAGDALHTPDPAFASTQLVGRVTAVAPGLGRVLDALRRPLGLVLLIYLPAAAIVLSEFKYLSRIYARPFYSVRLKT